MKVRKICLRASGAKSRAVKEELQARAKLNQYADILLESIANKTALKNSQGIGYKATERMKVATANYLKDYITSALPLMPGSKNASHRIAFRRGINNLINSSDSLKDLQEKVVKRAEELGNKEAGEKFTQKTGEFEEKLEKVVERAKERSRIKNGEVSKELENGDIVFKDKKGGEHILKKDTQELWKKTFELKSLNEDFVQFYA